MSDSKKIIRLGSIYFCLLIFIFFSVSISFAQDDSSNKKTNSDLVSIDFNNVDIKVFIKFISKLTGKNFIVDNKVKGNVTIISPTQISIKDAYKVFESVLDIHGFSTVKSGKIIKIIPLPKAKTDNIDTRIINDPQGSGDRLVTRIVPLEFARSEELRKLLLPLIPKGSIMLSYRDTNMLIITSTLSSIERLLAVINAIDIQSIGKKITVIPVVYADANKLVKNLSNIFTARIRERKGKGGSDLIVKFVADERTNSIILLASKVETQRVKSLIAMLDKPVPQGEERIRVFYLEHATAENMAKVLQVMPMKEGKTVPGQKKTPLLSQKIKITADKATNSLIIIAEKEDYPVLEEVIAKLDVPRAMVYIECLIMEVDANKAFEIGTEWKVSEGFDNDERVAVGGFGATGDSGYDNLGTATEGNLPKGFSLGVLGKDINIGGVVFPDFQAIVHAYQTDKDVTILSTPQVLTTENEEAIITIGKNVPYQTKSAAESGVETYNSYEYKDVGISLKITPRISKDRLVRLDVHQIITKLDTVNQTSPDRPTTLKREIETTIIVEDSGTVVIGGLIDESLTKTVGKTPCLGDIPFVGYAFKNESSGGERTNLYMFLTPKVVKNPLEARKIYMEKKEDIDSVKRGEINLYNDKMELKEEKENKETKEQKNQDD